LVCDFCFSKSALMVSVREHTSGSGFVLVVWIGCGFVMGLLVWMLQVRPHWQALALQSEYVELVAVNDSFITTEYMVPPSSLAFIMTFVVHDVKYYMLLTKKIIQITSLYVGGGGTGIPVCSRKKR
jgi:hypothetical protein